VPAASGVAGRFATADDARVKLTRFYPTGHTS
jgi:hypothetical protein